jgi:hypothetical protein
MALQAAGTIQTDSWVQIHRIVKNRSHGSPSRRKPLMELEGASIAHDQRAGTSARARCADWLPTWAGLWGRSQRGPRSLRLDGRTLSVGTLLRNLLGTLPARPTGLLKLST